MDDTIKNYNNKKHRHMTQGEERQRKQFGREETVTSLDA